MRVMNSTGRYHGLSTGIDISADITKYGPVSTDVTIPFPQVTNQGFDLCSVDPWCNPPSGWGTAINTGSVAPSAFSNWIAGIQHALNVGTPVLGVAGGLLVAALIIGKSR